MQANEKLQDASQTDALTSLKNRRYLHHQLPLDIAHFHRLLQNSEHKELCLVFMIADLDHFKVVNDTYGHKAGDRVIQQFAELSQAVLRIGDYVVRWGGEEFLFVLRPMSRTEPDKIAERIRYLTDTTAFEIGGDDPLHMTCSIGFVTFPFATDRPGAFTWEETLEIADHALYQVKENGRNGWACFQASESTPLDSVLDQIKQDPGPLIGRKQLRFQCSWQSSKRAKYIHSDS